MGDREKEDYQTVAEVREPFSSEKIIIFLNKFPETDSFAIFFDLGKEYVGLYSDQPWFFHSSVHSFIEPIFNELRPCAKHYSRHLGYLSSKQNYR